MIEQAGAELGQAQLKLGLDFIIIFISSEAFQHEIKHIWDYSTNKLSTQK